MDLRLEGQGDGDLDDGCHHERPCPPAVGDVHPGCAADGFWERGREAFAVVVASRLRAVGNVRRGALRVVRGAVVVRVVVLIERSTSQEGCARLVVRNFGRVSAARGGWMRGYRSCRGVATMETARRSAQAASSGVGDDRAGRGLRPI